MTTKMNDLISQASCALCGNGVHVDDHEGRIACDGCNMATDSCTCPGQPG